jgi:hypothetical protein
MYNVCMQKCKYEHVRVWLIMTLDKVQTSDERKLHNDKISAVETESGI